jgi:hypothetical protein
MVIDAQAISGVRNARCVIVVEQANRQAQLLCSLSEQRAIGEADEVAVESFARKSETQIGPNAGGLTRGQCDARKSGYVGARA